MSCAFDVSAEEQAAILAGGWEPTYNEELQVICLRRHRRCTEAIAVSAQSGQYTLYALSGSVSVSTSLLWLLNHADERVDAMLHKIEDELSNLRDADEVLKRARRCNVDC